MAGIADSFALCRSRTHPARQYLCIAKIEEFDPQTIQTRDDTWKADELSALVDSALGQTFGEDTADGEVAAEKSRAGSAAPSKAGTHVFIGHGRSPVRILKDFLEDRLGLSVDEFNRVPVAGRATVTRLSEMLDSAAFAFLIMTAEDEQTDGKVRARENVVHEVGLFQGRLGFERAIVLLEDGCEEFSNIHGLGHIKFPKDNIAAKSEDIREVLEREGVRKK
jgi:predicted nucleotide-binding protein